MESPSDQSVLPPPDSRRQRTLREPVELCTRLVPLYGTLVHVPPGDLEVSFRTRFVPDGLADLHGQAFPARPYSRGQPRGYEIESGDYSLLVAKDYFQKPLSNVASHSRGTTLYGTRA